MKRIKIIALFAAFTVLSTGCATQFANMVSSTVSSVNEEHSTPAEAAETAEAPAVYAVGDTVSIGGFDVTVNSTEFISEIAQSKYHGFKPDEGNVYLSVSMTVKNTATEAQTFAPIVSTRKESIKAIYDSSYEFSGVNLLGYDEDIHDSHLNPLSSTTGKYVFSVAEEVETSGKPLELVITIGEESATYSLR